VSVIVSLESAIRHKVSGVHNPNYYNLFIHFNMYDVSYCLNFGVVNYPFSGFLLSSICRFLPALLHVLESRICCVLRLLCYCHFSGLWSTGWVFVTFSNSIILRCFQLKSKTTIATSPTRSTFRLHWRKEMLTTARHLKRRILKKLLHFTYLIGMSLLNNVW
jgi:hypothetical protein